MSLWMVGLRGPVVDSGGIQSTRNDFPEMPSMSR
jgi:hypothetical protein